MEREQISCDEVERSIPYLVDHELDESYTLEIEGHVAHCDACRAVLDNELRLRATLRRASAGVAAPASLRRLLDETIERERRSSSRFARMWPAAAAAAILLAFIWRGFAGGTGAELDDAMSWHARNLPMDRYGPEAASFLSTQLPFAVHLPDLKVRPERFGGRVTRIANREAAHFRYDMPRGRLSVFVYEDPGYVSSDLTATYSLGGREAVVQRVRGYTTARYRADGLIYAIVSDLPPRELARLLSTPQGGGFHR